MSLTTYVGSPVQLPVRPLVDVAGENELYIGQTYADVEEKEAVKETHFSTPYVYEITYNSWGMELSPYDEKEEYERHKKGMLELCAFMDSYLQDGEFFELYTCWIGDEADPREAEIVLPLHDWFTEGMVIREKTLVKFEK